jgi:putative ABC transport system ATP-binding protein
MNPSADAPVIELVDASKIYRSAGRDSAGIRHVSLRIDRGELVLLLGPSGSGKTTLLTLMAGLLAPTAGTVAIGGRTLEELSPPRMQRLRAEKIGFVFQAFNLIDVLTAAENIGLVLRFAGVPADVAGTRSMQLLREFHIEHLAREFPPRMSQGEKQRVAVARGVANRPLLLLADEPTASLDTDRALEIADMLHDYARSGVGAVVVATHDARLTRYADRVFHLHDGAIRGGGGERERV